MNGTFWVRLGAISAFLSVAAGAFGAHGLKDRLTPERLAVFETAARYQMYHALAMVAVGLLARGKGTGGGVRRLVVRGRDVAVFRKPVRPGLAGPAETGGDHPDWRPGVSGWVAGDGDPGRGLVNVCRLWR